MKKTIELQCEKCLGSGIHIRINPEWMREKRLKAGLSLRETARRIGISAAYLSDIERGNRNANTEVISTYENI